MKYHLLLGLTLAIYFIPSKLSCTYTSINTRQHQVVFKYSRQHKSEKDLPICKEHEVCSVLHKRFWLAPMAERLCRCSRNDECPWKWANYTDPQAMFLNSRSQLKFCTPITNLEKCNSRDVAITIREYNSTETDVRKTVTISCVCTEENYWKFLRASKTHNKINGTTKYKKEYRCHPLKKCESYDFCGHVRTDLNSIFYKCSCPEGHYCIYKNQTMHATLEILYSGSAYRAICQPIAKNTDFDY